MAGAIPPDPLQHPGAPSAGPGLPQILPGNPGGRPGPRTPAIDTTASIMNTAATKAGIPAWILWGVFGAESSFGKTSNWFGLTAVGRSTNGPSGSPTFAGDAQISANTIARLLKAHHNNLDQALTAYSGGDYAKVGSKHGYKSGTAYIAGMARQAPLHIDVPKNPFQSFAAGPAGDATAGVLKALATPAEIMAYVVTHLADPHFWLRVLEVVGGFVALVIALHELTGSPSAGSVARAAPGPAGAAARRLRMSARQTAAQPRYQRINLKRKAA